MAKRRIRPSVAIAKQCDAFAAFLEGPPLRRVSAALLRKPDGNDIRTPMTPPNSPGFCDERGISSAHAKGGPVSPSEGGFNVQTGRGARRDRCDPVESRVVTDGRRRGLQMPAVQEIHQSGGMKGMCRSASSSRAAATHRIVAKDARHQLTAACCRSLP
jgi:hypothetical protein